MLPFGPVSGSLGRILIVEDELDLLHAICTTLHNIGWEAHAARNGKEALQMIFGLDTWDRPVTAPLRPRCVVTDVAMPIMTGFQLAMALRGDPRTEHIPIVMLTAMVLPHQRIQGEMAGADQYLDKPATATEIDFAIRRAIQISHEERYAVMRRRAEEKGFA